MVILFLRILTCACVPALIVKMIMVYWNIHNSMLFLSFGSIIPFFHGMFSIVRVIPCPRMAAFVSNSALVGSFVALMLVAYLLYGNWWVTYVYLMSIWPWLAIGTAIARLHIGRQRDASNFSPLIHLPALAMLGAGSTVGQLVALKNLSITDCVVLGFLDPIWSAVFHSILIRRIRYFELFTRTFLVLILLVGFYIYAQGYSGAVTRAYLDSVAFFSMPGLLPLGTILLFVGSRAAGLLKCCYIKWSFIPKEVDSAHHFKSLFPNFPSPIRFRLDAIFDSGLVEDMPHAVGPTGTIDMYTLTDNLYLLPLSSIASWVSEYSNTETLLEGISASGDVAGAPVYELVYVLLTVFILSWALLPTATSKILFDRGSSPHTWVFTPVIIPLMFVAIDILYLNPFISRFQIVCVVSLIVVAVNLRIDLWNGFKRRYYTASLEELEFLQPSCIRSAQKETLIDALDKSGVEDFGTLVLETAVHHGNNIRDYLKREDGTKIWDPSPGARAAWKLAGTLVIRAIRHRKAKEKAEAEVQASTADFAHNLVEDLIDEAMDVGKVVGRGVRPI